MAYGAGFLGDHIPEVDPDPELDPLLRRATRVPLGHALLHLNGAPHRIQDAGELREEAVAGVLDDSAPVRRKPAGFRHCPSCWG